MRLELDLDLGSKPPTAGTAPPILEWTLEDRPEGVLCVGVLEAWRSLLHDRSTHDLGTTVGIGGVEIFCGREL